MRSGGRKDRKNTKDRRDREDRKVRLSSKFTVGSSKESSFTANSRSFCAHPVAVLDYITPAFFVFLLPLVRASLNSLQNKEQPAVLFGEMAIFVVIIVLATIKWKTTHIITTKNGIKLTQGLFLHRKLEISNQKITVIETATDLRGKIFGCSVLRINTEAGAKGRADFQIRIYKKDALSLLRELGIKKSETVVRFSPLRVALAAASVSSVFSGLVFAAPVLKRIGDLLGTAIEQVVFDRLNALNKVNELFPPAVNTAVTLLVGLYGIAFLILFCKTANFRIKPSSVLTVENGLITRRFFLIRAASINSVIIEQTPIMRLFKRYLLKINIAGYENRKADNAVLVPSASRREKDKILESLFDANKANESKIRPNISQRGRFYLIPSIFLVLSLAASVITAVLFVQFREFIVFCEFLLLLIIFYYFFLAEHNLKNNAISVDEVIIAQYSKRSAVRTVFCNARKIGVIDICKWPRDRREGTCKIRIIQLVKNAEAVKLKHVPYEDAKTAFSEFYGYKTKNNEKG